ncbi:MAG: hypothetical protein GWO07_05230, partial [Candidatus Dadabacteria bacterium]|nr:hypothetical protein [Candidatus Dadabacteria bacterium]NIV41402.1 hypothetical protein [Candidatus Dadabacteria bacterium]
ANTDSTKRRYFELVLSATALKRSEPADFKINIQKSAKKWLPSYFRIELGDLPSNRVAKIDSFTIKQVVIKDQVSKAKQSAVVPSSVEVPNLKITFSASDSHYRAWNAMSKKPVSEQKRLLSGKLILSSSGGTSEFTHMKLYEARIASIQKGENSFTVTVALSGMRFSNP